MTSPIQAIARVDRALPPHAGPLTACANDDHDGWRGWTSTQMHAYVSAERAEVERLMAECEKLRAALTEAESIIHDEFSSVPSIITAALAITTQGASE